jgi:hypothetical protein
MKLVAIYSLVIKFVTAGTWRVGSNFFLVF